jgi:cytochrome o ubiquinol oxidase subunit 1
MGMPRRMEHYDVAAWQPYLVVAALGAVLIMIGIGCLVMQLFVSVRSWRDRRDLSGDPWDGRTLEWLTASPPPAYNFAVLPEVRDRDAFLDMKQRGDAYARPARYHDIHLPRNTGVGPILGGVSFLLGFAVVWHIWWLAVLCALVALGAIIIRSWDDETEYCLPASEVERIENARFETLANAAPSPYAIDADMSARAMRERTT